MIEGLKKALDIINKEREDSIENTQYMNSSELGIFTMVFDRIEELIKLELDKIETK